MARQTRVRLALAWLVLGLVGLSACKSNNPDGTILSDLFGTIMPPTPSEAARDAFNVYDPDARRRSVALISASDFAGEAPYVRMYRLLMDDPDPTVRAACLAALGRHGSPEDGPLFVQHLSHETPFVRWEAAKALQKVHYPPAIRPLVQTLRDDEDLDVRMAAAKALGQYRDPLVFEALVGALGDRDYGVRTAAAQSLHTLTGEDLGVEAVAWIQWARDRSGEALFANAQPYTWQPYVKPRGFWDRAQFWKKSTPPPPRPPAGYTLAE